MAEITGVEDVPQGDDDPVPKRALVGQLLGADDPVAAALLGQPVDTHRNPLTYNDSVDVERGTRPQA